jgi:hypothetical protein
MNTNESKTRRPPIDTPAAPSRIGEKVLSYLDTFALEAFKSAGTEAGKRLIQAPVWFALAGAIGGVATALAAWLARL